MRKLALAILIQATVFMLLHGQSYLTGLEANYADYLDPRITDRRFKQSDIASIIQALPSTRFAVEVAGQSIEGRDIYLVRIGNGPQKVLLWSQMHGDEPTATMATMDLFRFFAADDELNDFRESLLQGLTLYFVPMLNPDGAEVFERRNALQIDLNRDALRLQCPESQILKNLRDQINPEWGFNLHDQNRYTSAGKAPEPASISFLAPAYNEAKDWNEKRTDAMQLIVSMNEVLQGFLPGKVGRYSDEFEPRAFGDNMQKWGTRTILIETGALKGDPEKQYLRKLNFVALITAFEQIANQGFERHTLKEYNQIPFNNRHLHDLIIREATIYLQGKPYIIDLGFRHNEITTENLRGYYRSFSISDLGDLHNYYGYEEFDAQGMTLEIGKTFSVPFTNLQALDADNILDLLEEGYTNIKLLAESSLQEQISFPLLVLGQKGTLDTAISPGQNPPLVLRKDDKVVAVVLKGQVLDMTRPALLRTRWSR